MKSKKMNWMMALSISILAAPLAFAQGGKESSGLPNPASVHCNDLGGNLDILKDARGEAGFCRFGKGLIEEWTLYRAATESTEAADAFFGRTSRRMPFNGNPASEYCEKVGGQVAIYEDSAGSQTGVCVFSDNSAIEEWTLYGGATANQKLATVLKGK